MEKKKILPFSQECPYPKFCSDRLDLIPDYPQWIRRFSQYQITFIINTKGIKVRLPVP